MTEGKKLVAMGSVKLAKKVASSKTVFKVAADRPKVAEMGSPETNFAKLIWTLSTCRSV